MNIRVSRREFVSRTLTAAVVGSVAGASKALADQRTARGDSLPKRPNILFAISDDQTWAHTSAMGSKMVRTPAFDRVARMGALVTQAFCAAPQCSPCRASLLTGRNIWQNEEAGVHASSFPRKFPVYTDLLEQAGYFVGCTGKGWAPGSQQGWERNPAGPGYNKRKLATRPARGIANNDYASNFADFLAERPKDKPFCFWYGCFEPHRDYERGSGLKAGKKLADAEVPAFLPDTETVRHDLLDYALEIEHFDAHLGRMIDQLDKAGELDNTLIVVTGDNGMPFPRAKANLYEYGIHMPMAVCWPARMPGGRKIDDLVAFVDLAPTFLEAAGLSPAPGMVGRSLLNVLASEKSGRVDESRTAVLCGRERHTHARPDNLCYPARCIRTQEYLYIWNMAPDRWPMGDADGKGGFHDIDVGPSKSVLLNGREDPAIRPFFELAVAKRPGEELYDIRTDPACVKNLAGREELASVRRDLRTRLETMLREQGDPRVLGYGDIFESYPRYSAMRPQLGGFAEKGKYNPEYARKAAEAKAAAEKKN